MTNRSIGDVEVSAIGLGGMPMSIEGRPDRKRSIDTLHAALDAGVTLLDTADAYHLHADEVGHNEELFAEALRTWSGDASTVLVATKGGHLRPGDGSWYVDGRPEYLKEAAKASLARLGGDALGLYQFHRPDPAVPYEDSVGAIRDLLDEGVIRLAGISNANPGQIRQAQSILGGRLASVQNQFSPAFRSSEPELRLADELGIAFLPWSPLGGITRAGDLGARDQPPGGGARLGAGAEPARHPDPGLLAPGDHPGLDHGGGRRPHPRGTRPPRRRLTHAARWRPAEGGRQADCVGASTRASWRRKAAAAGLGSSETATATVHSGTSPLRATACSRSGRLRAKLCGTTATPRL